MTEGALKLTVAAIWAEGTDTGGRLGRVSLPA